MMIHLKITPFDEDQIQKINSKLTEDKKKENNGGKCSKDENNVDFLNEPEFEKIKNEVRKIDSYFDENDDEEKHLLRLIGDMLKPDPVERLKLEDLI